MLVKDQLSHEQKKLRDQLAEPSDPILAQQYINALQKLFDLTRFGEKQDLSTVETLHQKMKNPLDQYQSILIGGSNGKGSTCHYLHTLAMSAGKKVASFTSPHLISFRERIRIGNELISHQAVIEGVKYIFSIAQTYQIKMSFFEATWALAAWYFARESVEIVIWEIGLGGRLDACNVCQPIASGITSIALDHTHVLGDTLEAIATEKAAIFREWSPAFTAAHGEGLQALKKVSPYPLHLCETLPLTLQKMTLYPHQKRNLSLAIAMADYLHWPYQVDALHHSLWPGRLEKLKHIYLDCAHNPAAADTVCYWLATQKKQIPDQKVRIIFGCSMDKDIMGILQSLAPYVDEWIWVSPKYPRCMSAHTLREVYQPQLQAYNTHPKKNHVRYLSIEHVTDALQIKDFEQVCTLVTGSCFLVGEARAHLLNLRFPEGELQTTAR